MLLGTDTGTGDEFFSRGYVADLCEETCRSRINDSLVFQPSATKLPPATRVYLQPAAAPGFVAVRSRCELRQQGRNRHVLCVSFWMKKSPVPGRRSLR